MSLDSFNFNDFNSTGYDPNEWDIQADWPIFCADNDFVAVNKEDAQMKEVKIKQENEENPSIVVKLSVEQVAMKTSVKALETDSIPKKTV